MPFTPRLERLRILVSTLGLAVFVAACSGGRHNPAAGPTTTLITVDHWTTPTVTGPPSTDNFCTLVVSIYQHEATLPEARKLPVRQAIVADYVNLAPEIISNAPASIAAAARTYFGNVATVMRTLDQAGLDASKVKPGTTKVDLLSPQMTAASQTITTFTQRNCHYTIGG